MKDSQVFAEVLKKIEFSPVLRDNFSPEQISKYSAVCRCLKEDASSRPFRIAFCGVFSSGKTSLINALLAPDKLKLPVGINPVTKMITRIRYGSKIACSYMSGGRQIFTSPAEIEEAVRGRKKIQTDNNEVLITVPSEILSRNVEILDTPGFNDEAGELECISKAAMYEADMAVLCCNALMLGKMIEKALLQELENITGHFSLAVTRTDNINDMDSYEDMMSQARRLIHGFGDSARLFSGQKEFVFPVAAAGRVEHVDNFRKYLAGIISDKNLMGRIQEVALRKSKALCICEIRTVVDSIIQEHRDSLQELETANRKTIRTQELDASMEMSKFESIKSLALDAAIAFTAQGAASLRAAILRTAINNKNNSYAFQSEVKRLTDQTIEHIISELAEYARSRHIKGYESIEYNLRCAFRVYSYNLPSIALNSAKTRSEIHDPILDAFWSEPVAWLAGKWNSYLDAAGSGIKTSGFTGGHEHEIQQLENIIALCKDLRSLVA